MYNLGAQVYRSTKKIENFGLLSYGMYKFYLFLFKPLSGPNGGSPLTGLQQTDDGSQYHHNHGYLQPPMESSPDLLLPEEQCVDRSEFDKYIKYSRACDSNHNYPQHVQHMQHMHHMQPQPPQAYYPPVDAPPPPPFDPAKTDDDFSVILADVRKTCYSS